MVVTVMLELPTSDQKTADEFCQRVKGAAENNCSVQAEKLGGEKFIVTFSLNTPMQMSAAELWLSQIKIGLRDAKTAMQFHQQIAVTVIVKDGWLV
jgi:hypothetical protein